MKAFISFFMAVLVLFLSGHRIIYCDELTVVFTANSSGKLRDCNCPNDPYGGLAERVSLIRELREKENSFLLVDGGNMVSLFGNYDFKASYVIRLMNLMRYDAAGAGCYEIFRGLGSARNMEKKAQFPLLSATIASKSDSSLFFQPYVLKKVGNYTAGVISVCDSSCLLHVGNPAATDYIFLPKIDMMKSALRDISSRCDFLIVLSQLPAEENKKMASEFPDIDLIVQTYGNKSFDTPIETSHGFIVSPGKQGQFVGMITLEKSQKGELSFKRHTLLPVLDYPENKKAHKIVMDYYNNIN